MTKQIQNVLSWLALGFLVFSFGSCFLIREIGTVEDSVVVVIPAGIFMLIVMMFKKKENQFRIERQLKEHTDAIDSIPAVHLGIWIALAAGLSLFIELMMIRLHSSFFHLFAYFKNVSLLSCFLGLGVGYMQGSKKTLTTPFILPLLSLQIILLYTLRFSLVAVLLRNPVLEQYAFDIEAAKSFGHFFVVYTFLAFIFILNALSFVPMGHLISRLMMRCDKLVAYSWNLIGSLTGIVLFSVVSFIWAPPAVWIILATAGLMLFLRKNPASFFFSIAAAGIVLIVLTLPFRFNQLDIYSPYQILTLRFPRNQMPLLESSNIYYQRILDLSDENVQNNRILKDWADYYNLPYRIKPKPEHVLVVGSGMGNDVAAAVRNGAGKIDAVEIDPVILQFGKQLHPESPYQAHNVNTVVNDARAFIRYTNKKYDLIVYGLLDSHSLLSSRSGGIRLDSYVYTLEGFREARKKLKDGGLISLTFSLISPELGRKLYLMLEESFDGKNPIVYQIGYDGGYTFLAGEGIHKESLGQHSKLREVTAQFSHDRISADMSTDNWPFFYMPVRKFPSSYIVMILLLLGLSVVFIRKFTPKTNLGFSFPCFFLGAGFMLIETKGITELALVYGSTWIVISIVIAFILLMAFFANLFVIRIGNPSIFATYGFLFISLIIGLGLTRINPGNVNPWLNRVIAPAVLTLPLFFSGFAFSAELRKSSSVSVALSSNLFGAMLGGFLEYNSMCFGFRSLYYFAIAMYVCAFICSKKSREKEMIMVK